MRRPPFPLSLSVLSPFDYLPDAEESTWGPFDPEAGELPGALMNLPLPQAGDGAVVVVAVASAPTEADWSTRACARVAAMLAESAPDVLLVDLDVGHPSLGELLGATDGRKVTDALKESALVGYRRSTRQAAPLFPPGQAFRFLPARGGSERRPSLLEHGSWGSLLDLETRRGTTVVLHVPLAARGAESMLDRADAAVLLGRPTDLLAVLVERFDGPVVWLGPPPEATEAVEPVEDVVASAVSVPEAAEDLEEAQSSQETADGPADGPADEPVTELEGV